MTKKILSAILVLIMACTPLFAVVTSADTTTDAYKKKISELQAKEKEYQAALDKTASDIKNKKAYSDTLVSQIEVLSKQISTYHSQISELSTSIAEKQAVINTAKKKISKQMDYLKERVRAIYMAGETSDLDIILGAKDFSDFIDKCDMVERLSQSDREVIATVQTQLNKVQDEKKLLVSDRADLEEAQGELQVKQDKLTALLEKNEKILSSLYGDQSDAKSKLRNLELQEKEIQGKIDAYLASQNTSNNGGGNNTPQINNNITVSPSGFVWPVPGFYYVISPFNENRGYSHKGIDITGGGIMGATCVAANGGTVIGSNNSCSHNWGKSGSCGCGGGYGNYVLISHPGGKTTMYAHLSSVTVSTGQSVSKGQTIGYVGSTGWSTGAHLHYETRLNGIPYNPMSEH
ncbi:MAG: peptidoglycan DD-metalloendopeptidase family protein [Oscillospiraceae bacterium]|nr:peptidoglycan DD-metalloendopeptidase family protein [Oscillospiraceae bacterium]